MATVLSTSSSGPELSVGIVESRVEGVEVVGGVGEPKEKVTSDYDQVLW